jgi:surface antigen
MADPYNGVCVTPATYIVTTQGRDLAVQNTPKIGNVNRWLADGSRVGVICQVNDGATADGRTSHTWDALSTGGWVYDTYLNTPTPGGIEFPPGIRRCGTPASPPSPLNPDNYPWPAQDGWVSDGHGYYQGECVSFAAWVLRSDGLAHTRSPNFLGNANQWAGAYLDATPHIGDVAQWDANYNGADSVGHVAYVTAVNANDTITVTEYNWGNFHRFNTRTVPTNTPSRYLHF